MQAVSNRTYDMVETLADEYATNSPFPHIVIEGFLSRTSTGLTSDFPDSDWQGWRRYGDEYQKGKMICSDLELIPPVLRDLICELNGPRFLTFLETLSGIKGLIVDPYLEGGGLHCSGPGGILQALTDFHLYPRLQLDRRLNLLLYLNEAWDFAWGGRLQLFSPDRNVAGSHPDRTVITRFGTCIIFRTDDRSPHGFTETIIEGHWRRSVALYYYTATEAPTFSGDTNPNWRQKPADSVCRRLRQQAYCGLIIGSRALAFAAHRVDPRLDRSAGEPR